jgi:hypothetical protein
MPPAKAACPPDFEVASSGKPNRQITGDLPMEVLRSLCCTGKSLVTSLNVGYDWSD